MKVRDLDLTPSADFEGWVTADDMVLAIDISVEKNAAVDDYAVVQVGISGIDPSLNSETKDNQYIRSGKSSTKTGTQRQFSISGDMYIGDEAQDFFLSHAIKYGTGQTVVVPYAFFNILTGRGEKGTATIAVNNDGSGNSGDSAGIDITLSKIGSAPTEFTYTRTATPDCTLSSLSLGTLTLSPEFNSATTAYTATTSNNTNTITAAATATGATIAIKVGETAVENGSAATWANGENTIAITVTNGSASKVYTVTVTKE